jgi:hypothetical protein
MPKGHGIALAPRKRPSRPTHQPAPILFVGILKSTLNDIGNAINGTASKIDIFVTPYS